MEPERARRYGFVPAPGGGPLTVVGAEGAYLTTADGRKILDAGGGAIVMNVGHGRTEIARVAADALSELTYVVPTFATPARVGLVERLTERWLPQGLSRIGFVGGGSLSVDAAIRLARQHHVAAGRPERWKVIGRELSYHGVTLAALAAGDHERRRAGLEPLLLPFPKAPTPYPLRCSIDHEHDECGMAAADALEDVIVAEGPETVAAVIAEPVVGSAGGALVPPDGYWPRVAEVCRRHGVLLIADEVMTGFGRTGRHFAVDHWGVVPDILVGGKGLGGGYAPIGGLFATDRVVAPLAERGEAFMFFTYDAHPASCAIADAVLGILEEEDLVRRAADVGARLREGLATLEGHVHVAEVRGLGLMLGVELVRDAETLEPFPREAGFARRVLAEGLRRGVWFYPSGSGRAQDVIMLGPPFTIGDEEIETIVDVLGASIDAAAASLPGA